MLEQENGLGGGCHAIAVNRLLEEGQRGAKDDRGARHLAQASVLDAESATCHQVN